MSILRNLLAELVGMFAADGLLSAAVLALLGLAAMLIHLGLPPLAGGAFLLFGCLALLVESVGRRGRAKHGS